MAQNWDYAELSKAAKAAGGPEKYVEMLELASKEAGKMETNRDLMTIIMCGSVPNAVIRIVFPLMIFTNQKKTLETITNNLRERKDD